MKKKKIYLMGNSKILFDLYTKSIEERNKLNPDHQYELVFGEKGKDGQDIQIIHHDETFNLGYLREELTKNVELRAIMLIRPMHYALEAEIVNLGLDYPLSVINVARQPIQTARLWEFLTRSESKVLSFEWEEGNWDDI